MENYSIRFVGYVATAALSLALLACGGGGGGGGGGKDDGGGNSGAGYVTIDTPTTESSYESICARLELSGKAFISPSWSGCCSGSATDTGVTVTVRNGATGVTQSAFQSVRTCNLFGTPYLCDHIWYATTTLVVGYNPITVTASDPSGNVGQQTLTVYKAQDSYSVTGQITYLSNNMPVGLSGGKVAIAGGSINQEAWSGSDGRYTLACIPNGAYTLTPASTLGYEFTPTTRAVTVTGADATGQNFSVEAYQVSGKITDHSPSSNFWGSVVFLGDSGTHFTYVDSQGNYLFVVPNGTYAVTPRDLDYPYSTGVYTPAYRDVTVDHASVGGVDFDRY